MWFSLSQAGMAKITVSREHLSFGTQCVPLTVTPADRNSTKKPSALKAVFERGHFHTFFPPKGALLALSSSPSSTLLGISGPCSKLGRGWRWTFRSARSCQGWHLLHHAFTCTNTGRPQATDLSAKVTVLVRLKVVRGAGAPGLQGASCQG